MRVRNIVYSTSAIIIVSMLLQRCSISSDGAVNLNVSIKPFEYLSDYNFFKGNDIDFNPNDGVIPYDLNTPLFSDYAEKLRFIYVPEGKKAIYKDSSVIDFPVGSCIIKTFYYPNDFRNKNAARNVLETRLLVRRESGWEALPYIWNDDQTDAKLEVAGGTKMVSWIDKEGVKQELRYSIPNKNQCKNCHVSGTEITPIGPKVRNLNKLFTYADTTQNQLEYWASKGVFGGLKCPTTKPKNPVWNDPSTGSLQDRAKAYLDVNCAHCHNPKGRGNTSGLDLRFENQNMTSFGLCKSPIAAGRGAGDMLYDVYPGHPEQSITLYRMKSIDSGEMMPEIGRTLVHKEGVELIREWIASLDPETCK